MKVIEDFLNKLTDKIGTVTMASVPVSDAERDRQFGGASRNPFHFYCIFTSDICSMSARYSVGAGIVELWIHENSAKLDKEARRLGITSIGGFTGSYLAFCKGPRLPKINQYSIDGETFWKWASAQYRPSMNEVLLSLASDAATVHESGPAYGFEEWAYDFGMNPDSREAERSYEEVMANTRNLRELLGNSSNTITELIELSLSVNI